MDGYLFQGLTVDFIVLATRLFARRLCALTINPCADIIAQPGDENHRRFDGMWKGITGALSWGVDPAWWSDGKR